MITLYKAYEQDFRHNGLGVLDKHIKNDVVTWKDNNLYAFSFSYPVFAHHGLKIKGDCIVRVPTPLGNQLFRIFRPKTENGVHHVEALHISYDLSKNLIEDTFIVEKNGHDALNQMASKMQFKQPFTFSSDIKTENSSRVVRKNPIEFLIDESLDNSFINRWGGHLIRDNFHLSMVANPERNKVVTLRDRKNVKGYSSDLDYEPIVTRIMPQGFDGLFLPEKYIDSPLINRYPYPRIQVVEFSDVKAEKDGQLDNEGTVPLKEAYDLLRKKSKECFSKLNFDEPQASYKLDFIELKKTEAYKEFEVIEQILPNDRVNFIHDGDLEITANLVGYTYRPTTSEYLTMELGNFKPTFTNVVNEVQTVSNSIPIISNDISKNHTDTARGAYGGSVIMMNPKDIGQGTSEKPFLQVFMNKNTLKSSDKFLVLNSEGLGFIKGPFDLKKFSASWGIDGVLSLGEGMLRIGTDATGRFLENTSKGLEFFNKDTTIGSMGVSARPFPLTGELQENADKALSIQLEDGRFIKLQATSDKPKNGETWDITGLYLPNIKQIGEADDIILINYNNKHPKSGLALEGNGSFLRLTSVGSSNNKSDIVMMKGDKVEVKTKNGFFVDGVRIDQNGGGTGGNNSGGNLGSREDYAKNLITAEFNVDYDKMYASYVNFGRIRAWGLTSRASFNELNNIIRQNGVSPVFFWAYEGGEGYHSSLSFLNHFPANGSSPQEEARRTAAWVKETSLQNGSLAWYDAMYPYYTSPPDKQAVGNAYMADTQPGAIARVMLQGTAAATWAMFDPPALNASVNGVQDYADPFAHQMSLIKSWQSVSKYGRPMSSYTVTSEFGWRNSPLGGGMEFHNAIDLANGGGSPIMASNSGTVIRADANWFDWYGNYVVIRHPDGLYTGYAHLSQINVKIGQEVQKGQVVGLEGATGPVTGPHLHFQFMKRFEVVSNNDFENPRKYVDL